MVGSIGTIETDFFMLNVEDHPTPVNVPFSTLIQLEISQGRKAKTITGGVIGLLVGAGVGALVGVTQKESFGEVRELAVPVYAGLGSLPGLLLGLVVGTVVHTDRWEEVTLPSSGTE
jgi:hypothetical protein